MGRRYTKEEYLTLYKKIKEKIKNVSITTDIIVGFPNETKEDFKETLEVVKECKFDGAFTFIYSPREGTPASKIKDNMHVVAMDLKGENLTSEQFASYIENCGVMGNSNIAFIIGGSLGLSQKVIKRANYKLCFSKMTFPHQLFRVMLLEQIYRGFRIMKNEPYHK